MGSALTNNCIPSQCGAGILRASPALHVVPLMCDLHMDSSGAHSQRQELELFPSDPEMLFLSHLDLALLTMPGELLVMEPHHGHLTVYHFSTCT